MLAAGVLVGAGTDATRVASYKPWVSLAWLVTGRTVGRLRMYLPANRPDREAAPRLWTEANTWFSTEVGKKGRITAGQLANVAVLSADDLGVPENEIAHLEAVLTIFGGKVVYGAGDFAALAPPPPPVLPDWSPARTFGGYHRRAEGMRRSFAEEHVGPAPACACGSAYGIHRHAHVWARLEAPVRDQQDFWGALGCAC